MIYEYIPKGVCARRFVLSISDNGVIEDIAIEGGCDGNLKGISALIRGQKADDVAKLLAGIRCGGRQTSCPDQIAKALTMARK